MLVDPGDSAFRGVESADNGLNYSLYNDDVMTALCKAYAQWIGFRHFRAS